MPPYEHSPALALSFACLLAYSLLRANEILLNKNTTGHSHVPIIISVLPPSTDAKHVREHKTDVLARELPCIQCSYSNDMIASSNQ